MRLQTSPDARYAAELLERSKANPQLFNRIMRMYEVCGSNTSCLRKETRRLYAELAHD